MSLEPFNLQLFLAINASPIAHLSTIHLAIFIANDLLYLMPLFLLAYWAIGDRIQKKIVLKSVCVALLALGAAQIIGHVYPHPRPFMMGIGRTLIYHVPDPSFPSDHMTLFSSIAATFLLSRKYLIGWVIFIMAWIVAWARIYIGVHFPFDMIGAFILSISIALLIEPVWKKIGDQFTQLFIYLYEMTLGRLLKINKAN